MHRALLLPEIVTNILQTGKSSTGLLHAALFVNKLFFHEACRILWYGCGTDWNSATAGHVTPDIRHLAQIAHEDVHRAQIYADLIHVLMFRDEGEFSNPPFAEEARFHPELAKLKFPQLEDVEFFESENSRSLNTGDVVLQYAQPNLKRLGLHSGSNLSEEFLDMLSNRCPKISWLTLFPRQDLHVTEEGLIRFLEKTSLVYLALHSQFSRIWTQKAFEIIATYPNLTLLNLPRLEETWIKSVDRNIGKVAFPKLKHLYTSMSDGGLGRLNRIMPDLETVKFRIYSSLPTHGTLFAASAFSSLRELKLELAHGSHISGHGLLQLARACPNMAELHIQELQIQDFDDESGLTDLPIPEWPTPPTAEGITDDLIDEFAEALPKLKSLRLIFRAPELPTFASLRSFGRHCPDLENLAFSCNIDWRQISQMPSGVIFPKLWELEIWPGRRGLEVAADDKERIKRIAMKIKELIPEIFDFKIERVDGGNEAAEAEEALVDKMTDIIYDNETDEGDNEEGEESDGAESDGADEGIEEEVVRGIEETGIGSDE